MPSLRRSAQKPTIVESDSQEESSAAESSENEQSVKYGGKRARPSSSDKIAKKARRSGGSAASKISKADDDDFDLDAEANTDDEEESEIDEDDEYSSEAEENIRVESRPSGKKGSYRESRAIGSKYKGNGDSVVVSEVQKAPTTGLVPDGQVSPNTMHLLEQLCVSENNDRDWLALHDPLYRYCVKNWSAFAESLLTDMIEVDPTLPWMPSKDLVYRIYRDVRFSNDKTPYKTYMSASFSRGGRKGAYAGYHVVVQPGARSGIYAGMWCPEKEVLTKLRRAFIEQSELSLQIKKSIASKAFINYFGPPKKDGKGKGKRSSLWGREDELKNAPKMEGVDKSHPEIEFLRLRSFVVGKNFDDKTVLSPTFRKEVCKVVEVMAEFVQTLNDICFPDDLPSPPSSDNDENL